MFDVVAESDIGVTRVALGSTTLRRVPYANPSHRRRAGLPCPAQSDSGELVSLQRLKIPSKLIVFPEENHWISKGEDSRFWYGEVRNWLASIFSRVAASQSEVPARNNCSACFKASGVRRPDNIRPISRVRASPSSSRMAAVVRPLRFVFFHSEMVVAESRDLSQMSYT